MTPTTYRIPGENEWSTTTVLDEAGHPNAYRLKAICMNCKWRGQVRIPRGRSAPSWRAYVCPMCECRTVQTAELAGTDSEENDSTKALERYLENRRRMNERLFPPLPPLTAAHKPPRRRRFYQR